MQLVESWKHTILYSKPHQVQCELRMRCIATAACIGQCAVRKVKCTADTTSDRAQPALLTHLVLDGLQEEREVGSQVANADSPQGQRGSTLDLLAAG